MQNLDWLSPSVLEDLEAVSDRSEIDLRTIVDSPTVITGGSGFIGTWLTLSWVYAHKKFGGGGKLLVTSRNSESNRHLLESINPFAPVTYLDSDIREFVMPPDFENSFLVHAATPASDELNRSNPDLMLSIVVDGQKQVVLESKRVNVKRFLFLSSGAVYGPQPLDLPYLSEEMFNPSHNSSANSAYGEGKRISEGIGNRALHESGLQFVTARLFAFLAPYLPMDTHFAAGNFLSQATNALPITISSGGGSQRTYQYGSDMVVWLWSLLVKGQAGEAYNVGSDQAVSILGLAQTIQNQVRPMVDLEVLGIDAPNNISRYVPSVEKIKKEFGVDNQVELAKAIERTESWIRFRLT
jgi:nucleoside-diphosphate-sugar epimerase